MNNQTDDLLENLITKHNFMVKVSLCDDDPLCVDVDFAGQKKCYYRIITDEDGNIYGLAYSSSLMLSGRDEGDLVGEEFIPLNPSVIRTYIICDIFRQCRKLDLPYDIVCYFTSLGERVEFTKLLELKLDESDRESEQVLEGCMSLLLNGEVNIVKMSSELEKIGLLHSLNILQSTLI